jgi:tetratricopeptide (TPR) repeat protein
MSQRLKKHLRPKTDVAPSGFTSSLTSRPENHTIAHNLRWLIPGICLLIVAATWVIFGQTVRYEFVNIDDDIYVYENPRITSGLTFQGIRWAFFHSYSNFGHSYSYYWAPLPALSHMLDCQLYGLSPGGHHLMNVLLHSATAVLLFLVLREMTGMLWRSAFVASVFAIHPLRVESVAWIAERKDVLSGLFFVLTLAAYVSYVRHLGGKGSRARYFAVASLFAIGLMSKPSLVTLPFVLLLLDYWPLNRLDQPFSANASAEPIRRQDSFSVFKGLLIEKIPLFGLSAASCVVTILTMTHTLVPVEQRSMAARLGNAIVSYTTYVGQTFYPANLAVFYPFPASGIPPWEILLSLVLLAFVTVGGFVLRRSKPYLVVGWLWYLGMLTPTIGLIQAGEQARADHFTYLPHIGLLLLIAWAMGDLCASPHRRRPVLGAGALMAVAALMACAHVQASHWKNSVSLLSHTLACTSGNNAAHNNLGTALLQMGRVDEAAIHFQKILEVQPQNAEARNNLGNVLFQKGRVDEAVADYQKALEINPKFALARYNLGVAFLQSGRVHDAVGDFQKAVKIAPDFAKAHYNLGIALVQLGQVSDAVVHYNKALEINPNYAESEYNLGIALLQIGRLDEAVSHYNKALVINPNYVEAHNNLGTALVQLGRVNDALAHFQRAIEISPLNVEAPNNMALVLATFPESRVRDGTKAVELAKRADQLTEGGNASVSATLAAAYAEARQFPNAITTAKRALQLATDQGNTALADAIRAQIRLYQAGFPYRYNSRPLISGSGTQQ